MRGKYAYPDSSGGSIWAQALPQADKQAILISVRDKGVGLPPGFDSGHEQAARFPPGQRASKQSGSELTRLMSAVGVKFTLLIPL